MKNSPLNPTNMDTEDLELFSRQLSRETHQSDEATTRLRNRTKRAESKSYASSTIYGQSLLKITLALFPSP